MGGMNGMKEGNLKVDFLLPEWDEEADCLKLLCPICSSKWIVILSNVFVCDYCKLWFSRYVMN